MPSPSDSEITLLHTADLQIGMRAHYVADAAETVRAARLETLQRIVQVAHRERVDLILIAGDLFEDNSVGNPLVYRVLRLLEEAAPIPVYILPGNHDLYGPGSIYQRPAFRSAPSHIHVLTDTRPISVGHGQAWLLPAPITQKRSERDPTAGMPPTPPGALRIGVAHGSPRIEGKHKPDDHPIRLDAAQAEGLDYLALGHWHSWFQLNPQTVMPGTPEPTAFDETSGKAAKVRLRRGEEPHVEPIDVATLQWYEREVTLESGPAALDELRHWAEVVPTPERSLVRMIVKGQASADTYAALDALREWLQARFLYADVNTEQLTPEMSAGRLQEVAAAHPFLAGLLNDLAHLSLSADPFQLTRQQVAVGLEEGAAASAQRVPPLAAATLRQLLTEVDAEPEVIDEALRQLGRITGEVWE